MIGIVVATAGVSKFKNVIEKVRNQIAASGKSSYVFAVGKVSVAKLANFAEIEAFVLVACPENSLLDSRDFHVPIITPFELEISLDLRNWGKYSVDFEDYLDNSAEKLAEDDQELEENDSNGDNDTNDNDDEDAPYFSLVSGQYVSKSISNNSQPALDLTKAAGGGQLISYKSSGAEFLSKREYKGLESNIGMNEVVAATKGKEGIASEYRDVDSDSNGDEESLDDSLEDLGDFALFSNLDSDSD